MSKNDDVIVQSSQDVATLVAQLMSATTVLRVSQADINYKECGTLGCRPLPNLLFISRCMQQSITWKN